MEKTKGTAITGAYNKNRWRGDPLWRSCELFCVGIFHESEGQVKYHYSKQWTWSPQGIPTHLFLFLCHTIDVISSSDIVPVQRDLHRRWRSRSKQAIVRHNNIPYYWFWSNSNWIVYKIIQHDHEYDDYDDDYDDFIQTDFFLESVLESVLNWR